MPLLLPFMKRWLAKYVANLQFLQHADMRSHGGGIVAGREADVTSAANLASQSLPRFPPIP